MSSRNDFVKGLRELADFYEARPNLPIPYFTDKNAVLAAFTKEEAANLVKQIGRVSKKEHYGYMRYTKAFSGNISLCVQVSQEQVCRKKITGYKDVPEQIFPARREEIVEWECEPLLAKRPEDKLTLGANYFEDEREG